MKKSIFVETIKVMIMISGMVFYTIPSDSNAQDISSLQNLGKPSGSFEVSPRFPTPHSTVRVTFRSYSFNTDTTRFIWFVDNKQVIDERGASSISVMLEQLGTTKNIRLLVRPANQKETEFTYSLTAHDVDLLWSADTYTPPTYRGKALASPGASITTSAIPHLYKNNTKLPAQSLFYHWSLNGTPQQAASGVGKQVFVFSTKTLYGSENSIRLEVEDLSSNARFEKELSIKNNESRILFYETNPLQGPLYQVILPNSLSFTSGKEHSFLVEPYFFPRSSLGFAKKEWSINGTVLPGNENPFLLLYKSQPGDKTSQIISFSIQTEGNPLEKSTNSFTAYVQ